MARLDVARPRDTRQTLVAGAGAAAPERPMMAPTPEGPVEGGFDQFQGLFPGAGMMQEQQAFNALAALQAQEEEQRRAQLRALREGEQEEHDAQDILRLGQIIATFARQANRMNTSPDDHSPAPARGVLPGQLQGVLPDRTDERLAAERYFGDGPVG